jgi:site-specific recombinase XerD
VAIARRPAAPEPDLGVLLSSWELHLRAERKSPQTVKTYGDGVRRYLGYCQEQGLSTLDRSSLAAFIAALLDAGAEPATGRSRHLAVRRFTNWLLEEGEVDHDPFLGLRPPKLDVRVVEPLSDDQLRALLKACAGTEFRDRRDEAVLRLMLETGARAGEVVSLRVADVNVAEGRALVVRGKGGKGRAVPFGAQTAKALDRYIRLRRGHRLADTPALWLGERGKEFSYDALHKSLGYRASLAGIEGFHPHRLRHTAAHRWLAAGGSEGGLMAVAGWTRPDMLLRYTQAQASERAAAEARGLNLGEL